VTLNQRVNGVVVSLLMYGVLIYCLYFFWSLT
jgi:hypothetical protein